MLAHISGFVQLSTGETVCIYVYTRREAAGAAAV